MYFRITVSIAEAAALIPGAATLINGPAILLSNESKNYLDWIILDICLLESFISVDMLFSNAFSSIFFVLLSIIIHEVNFFHQTFWYSFLTLLLSDLLEADFSLFSCESDNLTFTLLYSTIFIFSQNFCCSFVRF